MYAPYIAPPLTHITGPPPKAPKAPAHPAAKWVKLMSLLYLLALLLALIAIFVPWSRTFLSSGATIWIGLWRVCQNNNNHLQTTLCENVDVDLFSHPAGSTQKCHDFYIATQVLTIITFVMALIGVIVSVLLLKKIWTKTALAIGGFALVWQLLTFACAVAAWACWLVYGEEDCRGSSSVIAWPVQGYSWGFILMCFVSALLLIGLILNCLALATLKKPVYGYPAPVSYAAPAYPTSYPMSYPAAPVASISPYMAPLH